MQPCMKRPLAAWIENSPLACWSEERTNNRTKDISPQLFFKHKAKNTQKKIASSHQVAI